MKKRTEATVKTHRETVPKKSISAWWPQIILGCLIIVTAVIYSGSLKNSFTSYDDIDYILSNPVIQQLNANTIAEIFSSFFMSNYHPLTTFAWALCYKFFIAQPTAYHLMSLIFHLLNILLVYAFFMKLSRNARISLFVSAFFALHPLNVESVAWISELKNVMFTFFFLLAALSYLRYTGNFSKKKHLYYAALFFVASLLSKSAAVTFPLCLLAIDVYLNRKDFRRMVIEKIPFFLLSLTFGIMAVFSQHEVLTNSFTPHFPVSARIIFAFYGLGYYVSALFAPLHLSAVHFFPPQGQAIPLTIWSSVPLVIICTAALLMIKKHRRAIVFGLLFYFFNLIMVLQLLPFGKAIVAERYAYVPMLGILFIVAYFIDHLINKLTAKKQSSFLLLWLIPAVALIIFSVMTLQRTKVWKDSGSLFADVVKKYPDRAYAHYALGNSKNSAGDLPGALQCYTRAIELEPYADIYNNRGWISYAMHDYAAALGDFDLAIMLDTTNSQFFFGRGMALMAIQDNLSAMKEFKRAAAISPGYVDAMTNAAYCAYSRGKITDAIGWYQTAYYYAPVSTTIPFNLGLVYKSIGARDAACTFLDIAAKKGSVPAQQAHDEYCVK